MKHPLWLLNSSLLIIFCSAWLVAYILQEQPAPAVALTAKADVQSVESETPKVSLARIYENDLFGTYQPKPKPNVKKPDMTVKPPQPPKPEPAPEPPKPEPSFLAPLGVTLKGIIATENETDARAIIADDETKDEQLYQVGDQVKDADIIHIARDNVTLVRTNGQQETLFITSQQAQSDPGYPTYQPEWSHIIKQVSERSFSVDPYAFVQALSHLAYLLEELDMTTAFEKGQAVGIRIGNVSASSLSKALGLQANDIITKIEGTSTETTNNRVSIYQNILEKQPGDTITVRLQRAGSVITYTYTLTHIPESSPEEKAPHVPRNNPIRNQASQELVANGNKQKQAVDAVQGVPGKAAGPQGGRDHALQRTT